MAVLRPTAGHACLSSRDVQLRDLAQAAAPEPEHPAPWAHGSLITEASTALRLHTVQKRAPGGHSVGWDFKSTGVNIFTAVLLLLARGLVDRRTGGPTMSQ